MNDLKTQIRDAESLYSKATKAELAKRYDQAYEHYVRAAELFLHLTRSSQSSSEREKLRWKTNVQRSLDRAEKIKGSLNGKPNGVPLSVAPAVPSAANPPVSLTPVSINQFAPHEQYYVLTKGSTVNGLTFPLWDASRGPSLSERDFVDPDGQPQLSPEQSSVAPIWRRPHRSEPLKYETETTARILPQDILQHVVTDCSVCASISVCLEHGRRFGSHLAETPMGHYIAGETSFDLGMGSQLFASRQSGRFDFRFLFNGAWRRIVIDDQLPYHPQDESLMCMSISSASKSAFTIWPSLMEKAYMKLMGGYDFPGSNSSIDLHAIAGWIPEHIEVRRPDFERERTWKRMHSGFMDGLCVVTLGTGVRPVSFDPRLKLLPSHSYAVIDVFEAEDGRMFTVLDSWVHEDEDPNTVRSRQSRLVNVSYSNVLNMFDGIYLSWMPSIWENNIQFHGMWKRQDPEDVTKQLFLLFTNTAVCQDSGEAASDGKPANEETEIWVLLTRHVTDTHRTGDFISLRVQLEDDVKGAAALTRQALCTKETYTNSTHVLSRTRLNPKERSGVLSVLASYDGNPSEVGFTLSAYSSRSVNIAWDENASSPTYVSKVEGNLTLRTAGGNHTHPSFMVNPQYRLVVYPPKNVPRVPSKHSSQMAFTLQSSKDLPMNIAIVRTSCDKDCRVTELADREMVANSGPYSYGHAKITKELAPGEYTLVVSSFHPESIGSFTLKLESMRNPFDIRAIPQEGAGMYSKTLTGSWNRTNSGGGPTSPSYVSNPKFEVEVTTNTQFKARLQLARQSKPIPLNITIYPAPPGRSPTSESLIKARRIATSGPYDDGLAGVATPLVTLTPGKYWIVPSAFRSGVLADFRLLLWHSDAGVKILAVA